MEVYGIGADIANTVYNHDRRIPETVLTFNRQLARALGGSTDPRSDRDRTVEATFTLDEAIERVTSLGIEGLSDVHAAYLVAHGRFIVNEDLLPSSRDHRPVRTVESYRFAPDQSADDRYRLAFTMSSTPL